MKTFTYKDLMSWKPCYEPNRYLSEDWSGTAVDILKKEVIPFNDRLWVVLSAAWSVFNEKLKIKLIEMIEAEDKEAKI